VPRKPKQRRVDESAALLRRVLESVERGELDASGPVARRLTLLLEGAVSALAEAQQGSREGRPRPRAATR
jgi:hypothetical protein